MKNLHVGKKLLVGFGTIILCILVILVVTVWTSLDRNNQLAQIRIITNVQTVGSNLMNDVNKARVDLRTVFTSSDYTTEYDDAMVNLNNAEQNLTALDTLVLEMKPAMAADYSALNNTLRGELTDLRSNIEQIRGNDLNTMELIASVETAGKTMADSSTSLVDTVAGLFATDDAAADATTDATTDAAGATATGVVTKLTNVAEVHRVLTPAVTLSADIDALRLASTSVLIEQNVSNIAAIDEMLTKIEADASALRSQMTREDTLAALDEVVANVATYSTQIDGAVASITENNDLVPVIREQMETFAQQVEGALATVAESVNSTIAGIITTALVVMLVMIGLVILAIAIAVFVGIFITRSITRPLVKMQDLLVCAGNTGKLSFGSDVMADIHKEAQSKDELGQSLDAFTHFLTRLAYIETELKTVAGGDLSSKIEILGPDDEMGNSLAEMNSKLNNMFAEINNVATQVATSSGEIASGSQSLAQGATEQASTIEEISASIAEITEQATLSAETSETAAAEGNTIRQIAQQGNEQMQRMTSAVQEISEASQSIEKVIKVIDDIAFQTNILALNAAVEAARAGEHGKGFAVVADEVRNLAGKSSAAAKETAQLISASVEKAELGLSITGETAKSLAKIVDGIQKSSETLQVVSQQSHHTREATVQVNDAVDQVAQVVQENSATSEESAAASHELSSQATLLQQLLSHFKLKANTPLMLPPASAPAAPYTNTAVYMEDTLF